MKNLKVMTGLAVLASTLAATTSPLHAGETNEVEQLKRQLQQMQEQFEKVEAEQKAQIEGLRHQVDLLSATQASAATQATATNLASAAPPTNAVSRGMYQALSDRVDQVVEAQKKVLPGEFNPALGFVGETVGSWRSMGSDQTGSSRPGGFDVWARSLELNASASVDPFAKGWIVANASADSATGESKFGIEEGALQTTSLPGNLTLTAGRFFGEFGRLSYIHDHELPFVNRPLVLDDYIGGESRSDGAQLNWLAPVDHYISLTGGMGDSFGGDDPNPNNPGAYRSFYGLNFWGRASTYFDLAPAWQLETGVSGLWNPRTEDRGGALLQPDGVTTLTEKQRRLAGVDFKLSYVPLRDNQFNSFTWGTEILFSDNNYLVDPNGMANSGDEYRSDVNAWGMYSYVAYRWSRRWSAGFLFDYLQSPQNNNDETFAYSPFVTFAISHWNQLRLQYTHTDHDAASGLQSDDAIYLQWAWIIGAHSHGWTQR
ncbi:MAG: hypothetical protein P4M10_00230 [Verrucomicrobiae bacterium]|nr:hypothetical protein [Verrucomicrobiae bacterium]